MQNPTQKIESSFKNLAQSASNSLGKYSPMALGGAAFVVGYAIGLGKWDLLSRATSSMARGFGSIMMDSLVSAFKEMQEGQTEGQSEGRSEEAPDQAASKGAGSTPGLSTQTQRKSKQQAQNP